MSANTVVLSLTLEKCIKITKWKVKEGAIVSTGRVILLYDPNPGNGKPKVEKLKASAVGTVRKLLAREGEVVQPGNPLLELEKCTHPTVMKDMCAECGADLRNEEVFNEKIASIPMVHSIPELKVNAEQAQILGKADEERLMSSQKLVLLVDLDQTLIHTTNDNIPPNLKDVHHFQLHGSMSPWHHTRLRPGTKAFLKEMSKFYELHICTFGSRMYAHMIAMFLDPDGQYFSHRILSRDECVSANSKTANLKALFPCGDEMVCIIDDREDVWNYAPNLIHVKPYHFFQHTGDINAPPGLSKKENDDKGEYDFNCLGDGKKKKDINRPNPSAACQEPSKDAINLNEKESCEISSEMDVLESIDNTVEESKSSQQESNSVSQPTAHLCEEDGNIPCSEKKLKGDELELKEAVEKRPESPSKIAGVVGNADQNQPSDNKDLTETVLSKSKVLTIVSDKNESGDGKGETDKSPVESEKKTSISDQNQSFGEEYETIIAPHESMKQSSITDQNISDDKVDKPSLVVKSKVEGDLHETQSVDKKQRSQTGDTIKETPEALKSGAGEPNNSKVEEIEVADHDDYLLYLEEILKRIHKEFYSRYSEGTKPDMKSIIPAVRKKVLEGTNLVFSGLVPNNIPLEKSRAYQVAISLGAKVTQDLNKNTTHLVAVRPGTAKVNSARRMKNVFMITADWLWVSAERWERVDEKVFPLGRNRAGTRHPPPHCGSPEHTPSEPATSTGRSRTASGRFMDTINPLLSFSSADIADMDQEVNDIFDESESDGDESKPSKQQKTSLIPEMESESEDDRKPTALPLAKKKDDEDSESSSSSADSLSGEHPHGWGKHDLKRKRPDCNPGTGTATESDGEEENEDMPSTKFRRGEALPSDLDLGENESDSPRSEDPPDPDEMDDGEWNMMGAALEREFLS